VGAHQVDVRLGGVPSRERIRTPSSDGTIQSFPSTTPLSLSLSSSSSAHAAAARERDGRQPARSRPYSEGVGWRDGRAN
jgi:hypothetical protein